MNIISKLKKMLLMKKRKFNKIIKKLHNTLIEIRNEDNSEGKLAALDRVISVLQNKQEVFNDIFENPSENDFEYFLYDFFLNIEEDIADLRLQKKVIYFLWIF